MPTPTATLRTARRFRHHPLEQLPQLIRHKPLNDPHPSRLPSKRNEMTCYEIRGDQSGPVIDTAELSNQTSLNYTPSLIQTASAGTKVTAKITDVTKQG